MVFETSESARAYAGYGMGIRNPIAEELTMVFDHPSGGYQQITVPNPDLKEEVSHAFKLGYKGESETGRFAVEGFFTKYRDFIENNVPVGRLPDVRKCRLPLPSGWPIPRSTSAHPLFPIPSILSIPVQDS